MPEKETIERAREDKRRGKSPSTQAGEFVREEIHHVREGKHGARSAKQAIAIGLSKARRAGVELDPPEKGSRRVKKQARRDLEHGKEDPNHAPAPKRSRASKQALEDEGQAAGSHTALARQAKKAARGRSKADRSKAAKKAARTKGAAGRKKAAKKAARTRKTRATRARR